MKRIFIFTGLMAAVILGAVIGFTERKTSREEYEALLASHSFTREILKGKLPKGKSRPDRPDLAFMQDYLRTMDPALGRPLPELLYEENVSTAKARDRKGSPAARINSTSLAQATAWEERGPRNVGGRTRALLFDPADSQNKKVWAGGVSGGLWYNNDITNSSSTWNKVDDFWDNLSVSCIAADPNNNQVMYVGTGEFESFVRGGGIWKSADGGATWNRLPNTSGFYEVRDLVVRNESGISVVYVAVNPAFGADDPTYTAGLFRSADDGLTWTQVLPFATNITTYTNLPTDIEIGPDNSIWVGTRAAYWVAEASSSIYRSATGLPNSWTSTGSFTNSNLTFTGQIELAVAPSDENIVYAIMEEGGAVAGIMKSTNKGTSWEEIPRPSDVDTGIPTEDFTRGQAWYDLTIAINPTNPSKVLVGGIDLFKTSNGGTSWAQISKWWSGIQVNAPVIHADQHEIVFRPGFPDQAVIGNDGGVYYATNLDASASSISMVGTNNNYNVTQFYTAAIHPTSTNYMLGGTQDNGTQKFNTSGIAQTSEAFGGDGGMCFIDPLDPSFQIVSYVYNNIYLSTDGGNSFNTELLNDGESGNFINIGDYDSHQKVLFTAKNNFSIYKVSNVSSSFTRSDMTIPNLGSIATAMRISPYATSQSNLYVGTQAGRVFRIENASSANPVFTEITGPDFPNGSISGIAFGANEEQILVTYFNYGVTSIWETRNGGTTWVNREGNLPNMPVRWVEYHPHNPEQAYIATELGVWSTDNINVPAPVWNSTNGGLANVRTDMLRMRLSDGVLVAATHGRGIFTAIIPSQLEQVITFNPLSEKTYGNASFSLEASSTSDLPVSFSSSDPVIASINGTNVTIHGAGSVTITATQEGNTYYAAAEPVEQTLLINKATQVVTFPAPGEKTIIDEPFELTATATSALDVIYSSSDETIATVDGSTVTIHGVGTTTLTASQPGDDNYLAAAAVQRDLTVVSRIIQLTGSLAFGEVIIGEKADLELLIENIGTAPLQVTNVTYPPGFTGEVNVNGSNITVTVTFTPTEAKDYGGEIIVSSNATSGDNTVTASGIGINITDAEKNPAGTLTLHPNPVNDLLIISGSNFADTEVLTVRDMGGRNLKRVVESSPAEIRMAVADLPSGVYIIAIQVGNRIIYKRFTKD